LRRGIPYRVVGSLKFYEREEIKDAIALLSFLINPCDEVAFRRVVNKPARGIGGVTVDKIVESSILDNVNLIEAGSKLECSAKAQKGLNHFYKVLNDAKAVLDGKTPPPSPSVPLRLCVSARNKSYKLKIRRWAIGLY
jgi:DNA helicase-2/ATP-dependent DNA helicase PcrA